MEERDAEKFMLGDCGLNFPLFRQLPKTAVGLFGEQQQISYDDDDSHAKEQERPTRSRTRHRHPGELPSRKKHVALKEEPRKIGSRTQLGSAEISFSPGEQAVQSPIVPGPWSIRKPSSGDGRESVGSNRFLNSKVPVLARARKSMAPLSEKPVLELARQVETRIRNDIMDAKTQLAEEKDRTVAIEKQIRQILPMASRAQELLDSSAATAHAQGKTVTEGGEQDQEPHGKQKHYNRIGGTSDHQSYQNKTKSICAEHQRSVMQRESTKVAVFNSDESNWNGPERKQTPQLASRQQSFDTAQLANHKAASTTAVAAENPHDIAGLDGGSSHHVRGSDGHAPDLDALRPVTTSQVSSRASRIMQIGGKRVASWSSDAATWRLLNRWGKGVAWWEHGDDFASDTFDISPVTLLPIQQRLEHNLSKLKRTTRAEATALQQRGNLSKENKTPGEDCDDATNAMARLEVYAEGFDELLARFKTYRPLLSSIKQALDLCVRDYRAALEAAVGNKVAAVALKKAELELLKKTSFESTKKLKHDSAVLSEQVEHGETEISVLEDKNAEQRKLATTRKIQNVRAEEGTERAMRTNDELFLQRSELLGVRSKSELNRFKIRRCEKEIARIQEESNHLLQERQMLTATLGKLESENEEIRLNADIQCAQFTDLNVTVDDLLWAWRESGHRASFARLWATAQANSRRGRHAHKLTDQEQTARFISKSPDTKRDAKQSSSNNQAGRKRSKSPQSRSGRRGDTSRQLAAPRFESGEEFETSRDAAQADGTLPCRVCGDVVLSTQARIREGPARYIHQRCASAGEASVLN